MNKIIVSLATIIASTFVLQARTLRVVYIAHDVNTPVEQLVQKLESYYEDLEDEADDPESVDQTIIYLSSGSNPVVVNMKSGNRDEANFERVVSELYERNYHDVDTETDMSRMLDLIDNNDFLTTDGKLNVSSLKFEFYVTPTFWDMKQNEQLIASLFYILGINNYYDQSSPLYDRGVTYKVFFPSIDEMRKCVGDKEQPFGDNNVSGINTMLKSPDFIGTYE